VLIICAFLPTHTVPLWVRHGESANHTESANLPKIPATTLFEAISSTSHA
jgi:hypothetical protein